MDRHAGFAAALNLRGQMLQDMQRVAYHGGQIPHRLTGSLMGTAADFFLDLPKLELHKVDQDRVRLRLRAWGPLTITPEDGGPPETRTVLFQATLLVTMEVNLIQPNPLAPPQLTLALRETLPPLLEMSIVPIAGGPYSPGAQAVLDSGLFRLGIQGLVGNRLSSMSPSSFDAGFLGLIAPNTDPPLFVRVLDGILAIGINVFAPDFEGGPIGTSGNPDLLTDFSEGNDIAILINPLAAPLAFDAVRQNVVEKVEDEGASLDYYGFAVEQGRFEIWGGASQSSGSVDFSMKAVPQLTRPGWSRDRDELWFDMQDIHVDVDLSWWAAALATLGAFITLGFGAIVVKGIMNMKRGSITSDIASEDQKKLAARVQEFTLPGTIEPIIRLTLERFDCLEEGVYIGSTLRPEFRGPRLGGDYGIAAEEALTENVFYYVKLPFDVLGDDPQLSIRWTVRRTDTNEIVYTADGPAEFRQGLGLHNSFIPFLKTPQFSVECRVYRTLGADVTDLFNETRTLNIVDRLDRTRPFARWVHEVFTPEVKVESNGSQTVLGYAVKIRRSKLHRTDLPGRCRMASKYSLQQLRNPGPFVPPSVIEYLDELPFPVENLAQNRSKVCDYCFFGGPTKIEPLIT